MEISNNCCVYEAQIKSSTAETVVETQVGDDQPEAVLSLYPELDPGDLAPQLQMFRRTRQVSSLEQATAEMKQLIPEVRAEYSQVCQLIRLLLVSPAASAQAERSFSALRRLKTWLRTSMSEVRLNSGPSAMSAYCCWTV